MTTQGSDLMQATQRAYVLDDGEGEAIWFAGAMMVVKACSEQTDERFALLDQRVPGGYAVPLHVHHGEDEAWYLLEGEATFRCGDRTFPAGPGSWVFLPRDVPHTFTVGPGGARMLTFCAPAGFGDFVREAGEPARERTVPPAGPMEVERLGAIAARHGIELLGPPD